MSSRQPTPQRSPIGRLAYGLFGGPLLRFPSAHTREGRRWRSAVGCSLALHAGLVAGGAMLSTGGLFQSGGSVRGIEVVFETHGLDTGPLSDRAYAPRQDLMETAPETAAAETLPAELEPEALAEAPPMLADAAPSEPPQLAPEPVEAIPEGDPPTDPQALAAAPEALPAPSQLETPRSIDPLPNLAQPAEPGEAPNPDVAAVEPVPEPSPTALDTFAPALPTQEAAPPPSPTALNTFAPEPARPQAAPNLPDVEAPPEPPVAPLDSLLASLEADTPAATPPVVRSLTVPNADAAPPDEPAATTPEPDDELPETAQAPDLAAEPDEPLSPLASAAPPDDPDVLPLAEPTTQPGPVNWSAPFTPPPLDPRAAPAQGTASAQAGTEDGLDAEITAILSDISCGTLRADVGTDGQIDVRGFLTSSTEQTSVRDRLLGLGEIRSVADQEVVVVGEGLCEGLAAYSSGTTEVAADAEVNEDLPPALRRPPLFGTVQGSLETFTGSSHLEIYVETPDYPAHVYIDYFRPDGTVVHLQPNELKPDPYISEPASTIAISDMDPDGISVQAGPPYGLGMVVTLAASAPVFPANTIRPREETAEDYLRELDVALRELELDPDFQAQYGYVFVEAVRETADARP